MSTNLSDFDRTVLDVVQRTCGTEYGHITRGITDFVGRQSGHHTPRQHSALVSSALLRLEKAGLVVRLDDDKPPLWGLPSKND